MSQQYPQQPAWQPPQQQPGWRPPPPRPDRGKTIALIVIGALVFIGIIGAAIALVTVGGDSTSSTAKPKATASKHKAADPGKLDDAGKLACDDFAHGYKAADSRSERLDLAHKVNKWAPSSKTDGIADGGHYLANGANGSDTAWQLGADTFAKACLNAGWKA